MSPVVSRFLARLGILRPDRLLILVPNKRIRIESALRIDCGDDPARPVKDIEFIIDSGCSVTTMDLGFAQSQGIPTKGPTDQRRRTGSTGTRTIKVIESTFRFWLHEDQRAAPFEAPIEFEVNQPKGAPRLFGLKGIINQIEWKIGPHKPARPDVLGSCLL